MSETEEPSAQSAPQPPPPPRDPNPTEPVANFERGETSTTRPLPSVMKNADQKKWSGCDTGGPER